MSKRHDHRTCAGHFRHPAFQQRLCWQAGESEQNARAFADEIATIAAAKAQPVVLERAA